MDSNWLPQVVGNRVVVFVVVIFLVVLSGCAGTRPAGTPLNGISLRHEIDKVLSDSIFDHCGTQIKVISSKSKKVLYERNSEQLIRPASNLKIVTTVAALHTLKKEYQFKTVIYADSIGADSILYGNLYIKGFGDPDFSSANLDSLVNQVCSIGIKSITGGIVADVSFFDDIQRGPGWSWDDEPAAFAPFVSPLTINDNCSMVTVTPFDSTGDSLKIETIPATSYVTIKNSAHLVDSVKTPLKISRRIIDESNEITIEGEVLRNSQLQKRKLSVWKPELYVATLLTESIQQKGITVANVPTVGVVPGGAREIATHYQNLSSTLVNMNKSSDNLSAEMVLKTMGAEIVKLPGTFAGGVSVVKRVIDSLGIDTTKCAIVDGSGMSYYNFVTPSMIVHLLDQVAGDSVNFPLFYSSLPVAGVDGTLIERMKNSSAENNLHAKTGSYNGVSTLAGYVDSKENERLIFCISMQDFIYPTALYRKAQDKIGAILADYCRYRRGTEFQKKNVR